MQTISDLKALATRYVEACGQHDYDSVAQCLAPDVAFKGPNTQTTGVEAYLAALKRMAPIWKGNHIRKVFADDTSACVIYDFITSTEAGSIPAIELLTYRDDRIASIELFFDRVQFAPAVQTLQQLAQRQ